ncbi:hypothetical protein QN277_017805 [Acacia crassicarpa]|uniref:Uncharacterized protein n=1 Tax=Acacia crassicarpa TaxID=499986 RepID=A0AAE1KIG4_9FABA|nr:hypothetical protein QN277_017805 [Acacia crassicarpa]
MYQMKKSEQLMMQPTTLMMLQRKYSIRSYGCNEVYCSPVNVPFSWEYRPGLSKAAPLQRSKKDILRHTTHQYELSPPPCSLTGPYSVRAVGDSRRQEAPPPILCTVQMKENHRQKEDDPFLKAYRNCTQSPLKLSATSATAVLH